MSTHDMIISNDTGAAVRADINLALAALVSNSLSATAPATTYAGMFWGDTTAMLLKQRNSANSGWITIGILDATNLGLLALAGGTMTGLLNATPGINFGQTTFNYYGEGTWTPSLGGNTTYTVQLGTYTRVGRQCTLLARLTINAIGSGSTTVISGLPFTMLTSPPGFGNVNGFASLVTAVTSLFPTWNSSTQLVMYGTVAAQTDPTASPAIFQNSTRLDFGFTHFI